ncbi:ATP-binding cassette subfamily B protein RaxB [Cupriavidus necator]|nr:ATP-binding cassette subfamily B protein RaxB [Cupriavidus necator]
MSTNIRHLRSRFPISLKGAGLARIIKIASELGMQCRAVRLELVELEQLRLPCILHWSFNHFVVLKEVKRRVIVIHDPAHGVRRLAMDEVSREFTGVALEAWPAPEFEANQRPPQLKLRKLMGRVVGLKRSFARILVLAMCLELISLLSPFFMQWVIDHVILNSDMDLLTTLAIGFLMLLVLQQSISGVRSWAVMYMSTGMTVQWRANVFKHLIDLPAQYFEKRHLGDVVSRFNSVEAIQQTLTTSFLIALIDGVMSIATVMMVFLYSTKLGAIVVSAMCVYLAGRLISYRPLRDVSEEMIVRGAKTQSHFLETVRGIKAIQLFQRRGERQASWLSLLVEQVNAGLRNQKLQLAYEQWNGILFGVENVIIIWVGARMVIDGGFTVGMLMAFNSYRTQFEGRATSLVDKYFELKMLQLQGERLADIVLTEPEQDSNEVCTEQEGGSWQLELVDLAFQYAEGEPMVLNDINLTITEGESIALVGPSGCGKTTLINLILGIFSPTRGAIRLGGDDLRKSKGAVNRSISGIVMQDDVLFAGSIADNISFFDPEADQAWVMKCAEVAAIHHEISAMPMGYSTLVGDMGTVLSGGQKQRVLLARALYKRPRILILDEATSHLDIEKERQVNAAIRGLKITKIIVAHRPETIGSADRVIVIAGGRISFNGPSKTIHQG